jgi:hypothetical protein
MNQIPFKFGGHAKRRYDGASNNMAWPEVIAADPVRYPGVMQDIAMRSLHHADKPHRERDCPLCKAERLELPL